MSHAQRPRGFTFIEVMFAVLVLAAGVAMVATLLPAALRTAQETRDDAAGMAVLEAGFHAFRAALPGDTPLPPSVYSDGIVAVQTWPAPDEATVRLPDPLPAPPARSAPVRDLMYRSLGGRISSGDPTLMWTPFYYRDNAGGPAQVALIARRSRGETPFPSSIGTQKRLHDAYFGVDPRPGETPQATPPLPAVRPVAVPANHALPVDVATIGGTGAGIPRPDLARVVGRGGVTDPQIRQAAVPGSALVVVDNLGRLRVYRIAARVGVYNTFELLAGAGLDATLRQVDGSDNFNADATTKPDGLTLADYGNFVSREDAAGATPVRGYLVGAGLEDPTAAWDPDNPTINPHLGPSPVVGVLQGRQLR